MSGAMFVHFSGIGVMTLNLIISVRNILPFITLPSLILQNVAVENTECKTFSPLLW